MTTRRQFLVSASLLSVCNAAFAQQPGRTYRLAWITGGGGSRDRGDRALGYLSQAVFKPEGFVQGGNLSIESLYLGPGSKEDEALMTKLAAAKFDVIVALVDPSMIDALRRAAPGVPLVVMIGVDAVDEGLIREMSHPESGITGVSFMGSETLGKRIELLKEIFPTTRRVRLLTQKSEAHRMPVYTAFAKKAGVALKAFFVESARELDAFFAASLARDEAIYVGATRWNLEQSEEILRRALQKRSRVIYPFVHFVEAGGLATYQADLREAIERIGHIAVKVLRGTPTAGIPFEQVTRFQLVLNQKTAKSMGIVFPPEVLLRADRVID